MIKIAHLASYGVNAGDNVASYHIRNRLEQIVNEEIQWTSVNVIPIHETRNDTQYCKQIFSQVSKNNDMLLIGGGGLIEGEHKFESYWKLPFNQEVLTTITIPVVTFAVGVNDFRNRNRMTQPGLENIKKFMNKSKMFSVRNDGSQESISRYYNGLIVEEVPDPGLIFGFEADKKTNIETGFFQPAWNSGKDIILGRNLGSDNLNKISNILEQLKLKTIPHTPKDYKFPQIKKDSYCWSEEQFKNLIKYENFMDIFKHYYNFDYGIVMRGHGQLCSVGLNIPSIYFSTQDKVLNFSINNGFEDYNVDIREDNWDRLLLEKVDMLKNNDKYLSKWYEIRNENMKNYEKSFDSYCQRIKNILQKQEINNE